MFKQNSLVGKLLFLAVVFFLWGGAPPSELLRLTLADFEYQGAFRLPAETFGILDMNYSEGPLEYSASSSHKSVFSLEKS